jgi:hypothetical protein
MSKLRLPFSILSACWTLLAVLAVTYIGLIAVVMSYAATTIEFSESVRSDEAKVASLESDYLNQVACITSVDYAAAGYEKPAALTFVRAKSRTALR